MPDPLSRSIIDQIDALHGAVRQWSAHLPQNLPYIDLYFAFAFAERGEPPMAHRLVEDARRVMAVPVPTSLQDSNNFVTAVSAVTSNFLFKAFKYRIDQALAGSPHGGSLSRELIEELDDIHRRGETAPTLNPLMRAEYVISRMREHSLVLEPHERIDVYAQWTKALDPLKGALVGLHDIHEPDRLAEQIRKLYANGVPGKAGVVVRLLVLREGLPLAPRVGESFAVELLRLVPSALAEEAPGGSSESWQIARIPGDLLQRALILAGLYERREIVTELIDQFVALVASRQEDDRLRLINLVGGLSLRVMTKLGMRDEIGRLFTRLNIEVMSGATVAELRTRYPTDPERWAAKLQAQLNLASEWLVVGLDERAAPILDDARNELLDPQSVRLPPKDYVGLAQAYVTALGYGPSETGIARIRELFRRMDNRIIANSFTTREYYSRFHLNLVEDVILALRGTRPEPPLRV